MGNLGLYKLMVCLAKKVGGPAVLGLLVLVSGTLLGIGVDEAVRKIADAAKKKKKRIDTEPVYTVNQDVTSDDGMEFKAGDQIIILVRDGENALIQRISDEKSRILSMRFIRSISDCTLT